MVTDPRLLMIVPTRGRPGNASALIEAWQATTGPEAQLLLAVDDDDPARPEYESLAADAGVEPIHVGPRERLGGTLNQLAVWGANVGFGAVGFLGDDHRPRTSGWAVRFLAELDRLGTGIVYGNDLIQGPNLPTAVAMTSDIVAGLGYMVPGALVHMWIDNAWKAWGEGIGRLTYLPDVVIEHMHPLVDKAPDDALYAETQALMGPDEQRWNDYRLLGGLESDLGKLRHLIAVKERPRG